MSDAASRDDRHHVSTTESRRTGQALAVQNAVRMYEAEREARLIAEQRLHEHLSHSRSARESAAVRDYVMASAHCLLWYAEINETQSELLKWDMEFPNIESARHFLPIELKPDETLKEAWYGRRHPDDRVLCDRIGTAAIRGGHSYHQEFRCHCEDGSIRWLHEDVRVETVVEGQRWRAAGVCTDITARRQLEARLHAANARLTRSVAETHHRVKNNLQVVAALMDMRRDADEASRAAEPIFHQLAQHVRALSAIHDLLTHDAMAGSETVDVSVRFTVEKLVNLMHQTVQDRQIDAQVQDVRLPSRQVTALVVLINELVSNAVTHSRTHVHIRLTLSGAFARLDVDDDGPGFPAGFDSTVSGLTGLSIVEAIARLDLRGRMRYGQRPEGGGRATLEFLPDTSQQL